MDIEDDSALWFHGHSGRVPVNEVSFKPRATRLANLLSRRIATPFFCCRDQRARVRGLFFKPAGKPVASAPTDCLV